MSKTTRNTPTADRLAKRAAQARSERDLYVSIFPSAWEIQERGFAAAKKIAQTADGAAWLAEIRSAA